MDECVDETLLLHPFVFCKSKKIWDRDREEATVTKKPTESAIAAAAESFAFSQKNIQKEQFSFPGSITSLLLPKQKETFDAVL